MLTEVDIYNLQGSVLELPMDGSSGYLVKNIDGLGPVNATIVTTDLVGIDGGVYQASNGGMRNVVIKLGFDPSYDSVDPFGDLRRALYPYFTPKMCITMHFLTTNMEEVQIVGYVESFEPTIFTADPEITISIICPDPYFSSVVPVTANRNGSGVLNVTNSGDIEVGLDFKISNISSLAGTGFSLVRTLPSASSTVYTGALYLVGASLYVEVNTVIGSKSATYYVISYPSNLYTNLIGYITGWTSVAKGNNTFNVTLPVDSIGALTVTMSFIPKYLGL